MLVAIQDFLVSAIRSQVSANSFFTPDTWGGENRRVYRWNFNPIFVSYLPYHTVSGFRCQVSGMMNTGNIYR